MKDMVVFHGMGLSGNVTGGKQIPAACRISVKRVIGSCFVKPSMSGKKGVEKNDDIKTI